MMPDYGMGFWQCKLRYRSQDELLAAAREYKRRKLPLDVIVIDFFHWKKQGDWSYDPAFWPDPEGMARELKAMGIELMVSIWPTVENESVHFEEMMRLGYLVRADRGVRTTMQFCGDTLFYDATNPAAREYLWKVAKENYFDKGVGSFWLDEAEPEFSAYDFDNYRYSLGTALRVGNSYPVFHAKAFYDGMRGSGMELPMNLVRCAWAGSQRYGALIWSGDVKSSFAALKNQVRAGLNMAIAGIPWWTTDIGGFFGGNVNDPAYTELLVRWFQYGAFCPVFRLHGDRSPEKPRLPPFEEGYHSGADNEVWCFGEEAYAVMKKFMLLRERLRPYISGAMREAHERGTPPMRPLFYDFPGDFSAWEIDDEFLFGPDILVAPVLASGAREREVYLPAGCDWIDAISGKTLAGGRKITRDAPLDEIPVFLKSGSSIGAELFMG
jgi:alpha-D-xyloside xylohydrolase